jgi:RimJ/RimL family protein N-acetyltransferase
LPPFVLPPLVLPARGLGDGVVRLRPPRESDAHAIAEGCSDAEIARWTKVPSPYTVEDARLWIAASEIQREKGSELQLVIVRKGEGRPVGSVALRLRAEPEPWGEIGYWVAASARRAGVGGRAVRLLAGHGLEALGLRWIEIAVSPLNQPSRRLAQSAGFDPHTVELREFKGRMEEFELFRLGGRD